MNKTSTMLVRTNIIQSFGVNFPKTSCNTNLIFCKVQFRITYIHIIRFPVSNSKNKSILLFENCVKNHKAEIWNEQMNKNLCQFLQVEWHNCKITGQLFA